MPPAKTNAIRLLERLGVPFTIHTYDVDPEDLSAETVAAKVGLPPEQVFKTLCVRGDRGGEALAVIPGNGKLDLKALAKLAGERKMDLIPLKDVLAVTGYQRGAVTAFAARRDFPVFCDETIELFDVISVSAGVRGAQVFLAPADYLRVTGAAVGALTDDAPAPDAGGS